MTISEIQLYQILKGKLGDKGAEELVDFVQSEVKSEFDSRREIYATRNDIAIVKNDIAIVREDMVNMKSDLIKSIYFAGIIQFFAIIGSIITIINFTLK